MNIESSLTNNKDIPVDARGDIIQFYNKVFIDYVKDYVLRFSPGDDVSNCSNYNNIIRVVLHVHCCGIGSSPSIIASTCNKEKCRVTTETLKKPSNLHLSFKK